MRKYGLLFFSIAIWGTMLITSCRKAGDETAANSITEAGIAAHIKYLSHDSLGGRAPATPGSEIAMRYIAGQYQNMGLQPGADDGTWYQYFDIVGITTTVPEEMHITKSGTFLTLQSWDDFIAFTGMQEETAEVMDAEIVFAGYGIEAPEYDWNDYKDVDVSGKILLMMNNDPATGDPDFFAGNARLYYGRWSYKYEKAAEKGAAGAIIIHTTPSAGYPFQVVQSSWSGEQFELPYEGGPQMPFKAWTKEEAAKRITALAGLDLDELRAKAEDRSFRPVPLGVSLSFKMQNRIRKLKTANVLGLLPGADPNLQDEVVVYSAHYDHLGIGRPVGADSIYNGALDNASGVACMLEVAKAMAGLPAPPKRSILFAAVAAEESGLLGSEFYAAHPTFPPGKIAANINIDGANIWGKTTDVVAIGFGKSEMDDYLKELATAQGRTVKPDQFPEKGYYYRSDQFNFAKIGVPAAYLDTGVDFIGKEPGWGKKVIDEWTEKDYHQPSDEYNESWNLSGAVEDAKLCFWLGLKVGNAEKMPAWYPGDEFEAARKKAIADVKTQ
jgi:Zn-dependent M28 family amino/carboxypeptidase